MLQNEKISVLKEITEHNHKVLEERNYDTTNINDIYIIESKSGQEIYDFFHDESMIYNVDPFDYYNNKELEKVINEWKNKK